MKYLFLLCFISTTICIINLKHSDQTISNEFSLKDELNNSVIDGFFDGDTTAISKDVYFIK